jgi:hypothetical protein
LLGIDAAQVFGAAGDALTSTASSPEIARFAPVLALRLETWNEVGGKPPCPIPAPDRSCDIRPHEPRGHV